MAATNVQAFSGDVEISSNLAVDTNTLFVDSVGNKVGVGTTEPGNSLHIYKNADERTSGLLIEKAAGGTNAAALFFGVNDTEENPGVAKAAIFYERNLANGRGDIKFCNEDTDDATAVTPAVADTRMIIKNNGNVGIAKTDPAYALDVVGDINFTGSLLNSGSALPSSPWSTTNSKVHYGSGNVGVGGNNPFNKLDVEGILRGTVGVGVGGGYTGRAYRVTKSATAVNTAAYVEFPLGSLVGGYSPLLLDTTVGSVNASGWLGPVCRRRIELYIPNPDLTYLPSGETRLDDGGVNITFNNSTRTIRIGNNFVRSYNIVEASIAAFAGIT
jgi:hypothetical protein